MLLLTVVIVIFGQFRNIILFYFLERMLTNFCEGFLPIMICYYNCLSGKHISHLFRFFCCKKTEELTVSEMDDLRDSGTVINDNDELVIE